MGPHKWKIESMDQRWFDGTFTWWVYDPRDTASVWTFGSWREAYCYVQDEMRCAGRTWPLEGMDMLAAIEGGVISEQHVRAAGRVFPSVGREIPPSVPATPNRR